MRGELTSDTVYWNVRGEETERVGSLLHLQGKQGSPTPRLIAGDIGAVAKLKVSITGDTLGSKNSPVRVAWIDTPEPAISYAIEPKAKGDEEKISEAMSRLMEEDPTLRSGREPRTGELLVSGTGALHDSD